MPVKNTDVFMGLLTLIEAGISGLLYFVNYP